MTNERSNTAQKQPGKPFTKGDPRINRKGRPKTFDKLRDLAQSIGHEVALGDDGEPLIINGQPVTATEAILRMWSMSGNPQLQIKFMEVAYGKVPDEVLLGGKTDADAIQVKFVDYRAGLDGSAASEG